MIAIAVIAILTLALAALVLMLLRYESDAQEYERLLDAAEQGQVEAFERGIGVGRLAEQHAQPNVIHVDDFRRPMGWLPPSDVA